MSVKWGQWFILGQVMHIYNKHLNIKGLKQSDTQVAPYVWSRECIWNIFMRDREQVRVLMLSVYVLIF